MCGDCFDEVFSKKCAKCGKNIDGKLSWTIKDFNGTVGAFTNVDGKDYHKFCFHCESCGSQFDKGYYMKNGVPVCQKCAQK